MNKKIILLGANADIGFNVCKRYAEENFEIFGTYRVENENTDDLKKIDNVHLFKCDVLDEANISELFLEVEAIKFKWTNLFSSIGTSEPIGNFFDTNFREWEVSTLLNFTRQMQIVHGLYNLRNKEKIACINLMAGGGTNSPMKHYSAYCVSKIGLIKMCELIDAEYSDIKIQIIGPGFVRTKTHLETLKAQDAAGENFVRVKEFVDSGDPGTSFDDIYKCLRWIDNADKEVTSGRNFAVCHDRWGSEALEDELRESSDMYKLRRHGNK